MSPEKEAFWLGVFYGFQSAMLIACLVAYLTGHP